MPEAPSTGNAEARARFQEARAKFLRDGTETPEFGRIAAEFPDDPIAPFAELYAGISAAKARKFADAQAQLEHAIAKVAARKADPALAVRAELFLGIVLSYQGQHAAALAHLATGKPAIADDAERGEFVAAVAYSTAAGPHPLEALAAFDQLWPTATPVERAAIRARVARIVAGAEPEALRRAFDGLADRKGVAIALVASRLALLADAAGRGGEAEKLRELAGPARVAVGLPRAIAPDEDAGAASEGPSGPGDRGLIGAVVPLGGKQARLGEDAVAALGLAGGVADGKALAAVEVRGAADPEAAAGALDELVRANAIAVIGPIDGPSVDAAAARADAAQLPMLSLATRPEERAKGPYVFHLRHSAEARARALADRAAAKGVKQFAVLAPESGYGKAVGAAFEGELAKQGGTVVVHVTYPADTKSFATVAKKLAEARWDGVFVPEQADKLGLITPALAAAGKIPKPVGTKKVKGGQPVLLVSTAEGLSATYLTDAGRHSEGALLAPGFYPDDQDPATKPFVERYVATYGHAPGATEAYAFDGAQLATGAGAGGRAALAGQLAKGEWIGVTGTIKFDADHRRADPGVVYTVVDEAGGFAIRVAR